ncbi:excalibur calcium-binding domain-containing protein [Xanthomonas oryzae]|uniref:Cold shock domain protein n=2 Tax=Xanthomonas oryzae TaxID=347 RepID=G7TB07_XANOB|nr:excalibur calcium-binding domain-containing protein [Xanthomonas oryzae]AEQ97308.1 cold shock domain protein [Xanthomonas oryzae pv. oryzicola BLS256]
MRAHGTLTRWNTDPGFGFFPPAQPGDDLFVHLSAFPRGFEAPRIGGVLSFETEPDTDGRTRAVRIVRAGTPASRHTNATRSSTAREELGRGRIGLTKVVLVMAVLGAGAFAFQQRATLSAVRKPAPAAEPVVSPARSAAAPAAASQFSCGGRTRCPQMRSCANAQYVLQHRPGTQMDGDHDGVPCKDQWCR